MVRARLIRPLAVVALLFLVGGLLLDGVAQGFVCFDYCPPDEPAARLRVALETLSLGLVASIGTWVLALAVLAQLQRRNEFNCILLVPLGLILAEFVFGFLVRPFFTLNPLAPTAPASRALDSLLWSCLVLCGLVNHPVAKARGLHLRRITATPSGVLSMPVLRFPHIPTRFASGGRLTCRVGQPARQRASGTHYAHGSWSSQERAAGRHRPLPVARRYRRDGAPFSPARGKPATALYERSSGASSPCRKAGVSAPQF
jgi:hypothetical protein